MKNSLKSFTPLEISGAKKKRKENKSLTGFTLVELLIIFAIMGILAAIVWVSLSGAREKGKVARAQIELREINNAIYMLQLDSGQWPGHKTPYNVGGGGGNDEICPDGCDFGLTDCRAGILCNDPANPYPSWKGPYLEGLIDPWGQEYFFDIDYDIDGDPIPPRDWAVVVGSYGPNGVGRSLYDSDDVYYVIFKE